MIFLAGILIGFASAVGWGFAIARAARRRLACRTCGKKFHHHESAALCEQIHALPVGQCVPAGWGRWRRRNGRRWCWN